jgi:hypothetical protein
MDSRPPLPDKRAMEADQNQSLTAAPPRVVNIGLEMFALNLADQGAKVVHVQWSPPAGGNAHLARLLDRLRS